MSSEDVLGWDFTSGSASQAGSVGPVPYVVKNDSEQHTSHATFSR